MPASSPTWCSRRRRDDAHQDHRLVAELLAGRCFRGPTILEYEIPKWDGDLGTANLYVRLARADGDAQGGAPRSPRSRRSTVETWFTADTFRAILRLRGIECRRPGRARRGFVCRKLVV